MRIDVLKAVPTKNTVFRVMAPLLDWCFWDAGGTRYFFSLYNDAVSNSDYTVLERTQKWLRLNLRYHPGICLSSWGRLRETLARTISAPAKIQLQSSQILSEVLLLNSLKECAASIWWVEESRPYPEHGGRMFLQNITKHQPDNTVSHPRQ
jgi:hypothetical protein